MKRLFGCQGSIQLIAALAAAKKVSWVKDDADAKNYLLIYETLAPVDQTVDFARAIERMARCLGPWSGICYLDESDIVCLHETLSSGGFEAVGEFLEGKIGIASVDELYLSKSRMFGNQLLLQTFSQARAICYGDGIGLNFSRNYFSEASEIDSPTTSNNSIRDRDAALQIVLRNRKDKIELRRQFDNFCMLLPDLFDEVLELACDRPEKEVFLDLFARLASATIISGLDPVLQLLKAGKKVVFLLTCNFSEFKKMSVANELEGYLEYVKWNCDLETTLVIKPHPRDAFEKIQMLASSLSSKGWQVLVLREQDCFFIPFETIISVCRDTVADPDAIGIITYSTSCLSLQAIFGLASLKGFGEEIVRSRFFEEHVQRRLSHEADLLAAIEKIQQESQI